MNLPEIASLHSVTLDKMQSCARLLAEDLQPGDTITLTGEVGSGKTTFARALIGAIATNAPEVTSPTFTLMQSYDVRQADGTHHILWHLDLYRLNAAEEATALGLDELWSNIVLIEWPEIIQPALPRKRLDISFDFGKNHDTRSLEFSGDETWAARIRKIPFEPL